MIGDARRALHIAMTRRLVCDPDNTWHGLAVSNQPYEFPADVVQPLIDQGYLECTLPGSWGTASIWRASDTGIDRMHELREGEQP